MYDFVFKEMIFPLVYMVHWTWRQELDTLAQSLSNATCQSDPNLGLSKPTD